MHATRIGIVGDYDPTAPTHSATDAAIAHAAAHLSLAVAARWLATDALVGSEATISSQRAMGC